VALLGVGVTIARGDPISELASFSVFDKVDLAQLARGDVKTAHGAPMRTPRFLAVQSCYVAPGSPVHLVGPTVEPNHIVGGMSLGYVLRNWSAGVNYDASANSGSLAQSATFSISSRF